MIILAVVLTVLHCATAVWLAGDMGSWKPRRGALFVGWVLVVANLGAGLMWGHEVIVLIP